MSTTVTKITYDETAVLAKVAEMLNRGRGLLFDEVHLKGETEYESAVRIRNALNLAITEWEGENRW